MDTKYCVYEHKNIHNNKRYIGQTKNIDLRWNKSSYCRKDRQTRFSNALQKYPNWNSDWEHNILINNLTKYEADYWEKYYIAFYDTTNINNGYNILEGGKQIELTNEMKEKISFSLKEYFKTHDNPMKNKKLSEQHKQKISESHKNKKLTNEHKQHIKDNNGKRKRTMCLNNGKIFMSRKEAANWCGLTSTKLITKCINGIVDTAGKDPITKEKLKWKDLENE